MRAALGVARVAAGSRTLRLFLRSVASPAEWFGVSAETVIHVDVFRLFEATLCMQGCSSRGQAVQCWRVP